VQTMMGEAGARRMTDHPRHPRKKSDTKSANAERTARQRDLVKLQQEISRYESELRAHEKLEAKSKKNIAAFNKKTEQLKAAIADLRAEEAEILSEKRVVEDSLRHTASNLDRLKEAYANSSRYLYTRGALDQPDPAAYLLAPDRQNDAVRMRYYAEVIGKAHAMDRTRLDSMKQSLGQSNRELASTLAQERAQIGHEASEAAKVEAKKQEEARQLQQIQARKDRLKKLLAERKESAKRLEGIIANLVTKESKARTSKKHGRVTAPEDEPLPGPTRGPHSLDWPCTSHRIAQGFGEHRNAELGTVTMNLGIDIASPEGSAVRSAAEGRVALVSSLPGYGSVVVLEHSGGLHTVYADLEGVTVSQGARVHAGGQIARSGSNEESGAALHFEVWKGKAKQNPLAWLK
jgi:murein DD-endopeptidase MepM/ murein hydrolase activator NlpD